MSEGARAVEVDCAIRRDIDRSEFGAVGRPVGHDAPTPIRRGAPEAGDIPGPRAVEGLRGAVRNEVACREA